VYKKKLQVGEGMRYREIRRTPPKKGKSCVDYSERGSLKKKAMVRLSGTGKCQISPRKIKEVKCILNKYHE